MKKLEDRVWVAGQIRPEDIPALAGLGIRTVVNNRPDGEEPDQPAAVDIEAAARAAGLAYSHVPVAGGFSQAEVAAMAAALEEGPVLAFCRSGTRSTFLWALARASRGAPAAELVEAAARAGYDLGPILRYLEGSARPIS
jgi:uncharacterized protein (TIGR01244 family)